MTFGDLKRNHCNHKKLHLKIRKNRRFILLNCQNHDSFCQYIQMHENGRGINYFAVKKRSFIFYTHIDDIIEIDSQK